MQDLSRIVNVAGVRHVVEALAPTRWQEARCLFTLSTGRTGTQTLCELLNLSPDVLALHEPEPRPYEAFRSAYARVWHEPSGYRKLFEKARRGYLAWAAWRGKVYAEGTAVKYLAPVIADVVPGAKFLHLYRHPAEVVRSAMRRGWFDHHPLDAYRPRPVAKDPAYEAWAGWDPFARNCWMWRADNEFFLRLKRFVAEDRFLSLAFEDFVEPATGAYRHIFEFLGVACPAPDVVWKVLAVRYNEQTSGSFPQPGDWPDPLRETLWAIAGETMEKLGYGPIGDEDSPGRETEAALPAAPGPAAPGRGAEDVA